MKEKPYICVALIAFLILVTVTILAIQGEAKEYKNTIKEQQTEIANLHNILDKMQQEIEKRDEQIKLLQRDARRFMNEWEFTKRELFKLQENS